MFMAHPHGIERHAVRGARGGFRGFFRKHVIERGIKGLFNLGAAAEIAVHPLFLGGLKLGRLESVGTGALRIA